MESPGVQSHTMDASTLSLFSERIKPAKSRAAIGNGSALVSRTASSQCFTVNDLNRAASSEMHAVL